MANHPLHPSSVLNFPRNLFHCFAIARVPWSSLWHAVANIPFFLSTTKTPMHFVCAQMRSCHRHHDEHRGCLANAQIFFCVLPLAAVSRKKVSAQSNLGCSDARSNS